MFVGYADPEWVWPQAVTLYTKNFDVIGFYRSHEENPLQHGMKVLCPPMGGELQSHVLWAWILYLRHLPETLIRLAQENSWEQKIFIVSGWRLPGRLQSDEGRSCRGSDPRRTSKKDLSAHFLICIISPLK